MSRVYLSTTCLGSGTSALGTLRALADAGFPRLEMGSTHRYEPRLVRSVEREAAERGLALLTHNYFPPGRTPILLNPAASDPAVRAASRAFTLRAIDAAASLGSPVYGFHPGFRLERTLGLWHVLEHGAALVPPEEAYERAAGSAGLFADRGRDAGVRVLVENLEHKNDAYILCTADELGRFVRDVGGGLGVLLDLGHLKVASRALGFDPAEFVRALSPLVGEVHVNANDGLADTHRPLGPGDLGELEPLRLVGRDVPVTLEVTSGDLGVLAENERLIERALGRLGYC